MTLLRRLRRRLDLLLIGGALLLTLAGGALAVVRPDAAVAVVGTLGAAIVLLLANLVHRQRSGGRLSPAALESALAEAARAIAELEKRADQVERSVRLARSIARSGDEVPAWIALADRVPLTDAALQRGVDPRTLLALVDRLGALDPDPAVLVIADDPVGAIAARAVVHLRQDARVIVLTSTAAGTDRLRGLLDGVPRVTLRAGTVGKRSFGRIAGAWFAADNLADLDGIALVLVAGPSAEQGAAARHAVAAGVLERTARATLIVDTPDQQFVVRATALWEETAPDGARVRRLSPWVFEVERD